MNDLKAIVSGLLVIFIIFYAMTLMVGGPKKANSFAQWVGKKALIAIVWTFKFPFRLLKKLAFGGGKKNKKRKKQRS